MCPKKRETQNYVASETQILCYLVDIVPNRKKISYSEFKAVYINNSFNYYQTK